MPGNTPRRRAASATARPISARSTTSSTARIRARGSSAAAASCIPSSASPSQAPETFTLDNTAQAVIGVREGGTQAMRFDVVRVPAEQTLGEYLNSGWMESVDKGSTEDLTINGFPAASAIAHGDQWQFKVYALRFGSDVYRFIFAAKQQKHRERSQRARNRQLVPPPDAGRNPGGASAAHQGHHRAARRHRGIAVPPHGRRRPPGRTLPHPERARPMPRSRCATSSRSWWIELNRNHRAMLLLPSPLVEEGGSLARSDSENDQGSLRKHRPLMRREPLIRRFAPPSPTRGEGKHRSAYSVLTRRTPPRLKTIVVEHPRLRIHGVAAFLA